MKLIYILVVTYVNIQNCRICGGESSKVIATSKSHCLKMLLKCVRVEKKDKHEILFFFLIITITSMMVGDVPHRHGKS